MPLQYLYHDEIINPRGINSSIGLLIKEFHKGNPQLHISLARLEDNKITETGTYRIENKVAEGKDKDITDDHLAAYRIFKEEIMYNWIQYIELLIKNFFSMTGELYNDQNLFQIKFPDQLWTNIRSFVRNLRDLPLWKDRSMASTVFGGKQVYEYWNTAFRTGKTPDGTLVLSKPINVVDMIK